MSELVVMPKSDWTGILDSVRAKTGKTDLMTSDMVASEIGSIQTGVPINNQDITVTGNGTYTAENGYTGLGTVTVEVPPTPPNNQDLTIKENGTYTAENGYTGLGTVTVDVPTGDVIVDADYTDLISGETTELIIPEGVTSIRPYALYNASSLKKLSIPKSITELGGKAFQGCSHLEEIHFNATAVNDLTSSNMVFASIGKEVDTTRVVIGKNVTKIPAYLFSTNSTVSYAPYITSVEFEEGSVCESIGIQAFSGLTSSTVGISVIKTLTIPESIKSIASSAFSGWHSLEELHFNATAMNDLASYNHVLTNAGKDGNGVRVVIGKNVTKIPAYLFYPYPSSSQVPKITSFEFEEGSVCSIIGSYALQNAIYLTSITIPDSVTSIGSYAFYECTAMETYDFTSHTSVPTLVNSTAFVHIPSDCEIRVPASLYDEWIAATNWSTYADKIVAV